MADLTAEISLAQLAGVQIFEDDTNSQRNSEEELREPASRRLAGVSE